MKLEDAENIIKTWKTEEDYIMSNLRQFLNEWDDPDDDSIQLSNEYQEASDIILKHIEQKEA